MKVLAALSIVATVCSSTVDAVESPLEMAERAYPKCALSCLAELVPQSSCSLDDVACLCTNAPLNANLTVCVGTSCTPFEGLTTKNVSSTMCGAPVRDESSKPLLIGVVGGGIALLAFVLRMMATMPLKGARLPGWDDYTIIIAVLLTVPPTVFAVLLSQNGLGKDIWVLPLQNIENILLYYYMGEIFYFAAQATNKLSILLFILRIFSDNDLRKYIYGTMGLVAAYGFAFIMATAFQCRPVNHSWLQLDATHDGSCNNINLQGWFSAIFNIVIDLIILALPLKQLSRLNISLKKKLMVIFMFSLGVFVTIISVIRLSTLIEFANSQNPTYDYMAPAYWSTMELHAGIICASLPAVRAFFITFGLNFLASDQTGGQSASGFSMGARGSKSRSQVDHRQQPKRGDEGDFIPLVDVESGRSKAFEHSPGSLGSRDIKVSTSIVTESESDLSIQKVASSNHN